jgi:hypothetical protein
MIYVPYNLSGNGEVTDGSGLRHITVCATYDLKVGKLSHQDVGQMDMYVRVFEEHLRGEGDNPTLGLILSSERNAAVAKYSLLADKSQLFASKYRLVLPSEEELRAELERDRALLEQGCMMEANTDD